MTEPLPAALRIPEVSRFINRANQLRTIKPALAYWCEYHAVNQIVGRSLHTSDDDCFAFTKTLIERLEATKAERADDDAIVDNDAGQAYVEQFALETFARAERTLRADKVTRQTADTFDAAATFFDLTHEWGTPDPETLQKIKFAKWNAARILKAIREGRDPNESNPKVPAPDTDPPLSLDDPTARQIVSPLPASVEDAADEAPLPPAQGEYFPHVPPDPSSLAPEGQNAVPDVSRVPPPLPPTSTQMPPLGTQAAPQPSPQIPSQPASQFLPPSPQVSAPSASTPPAWAVSQNVPSPVYPPQAPGGVPAPVASTVNQRDINQAQKHAKWAISALDFEDVPTAVKELRNALAVLGAQL